MTRSGIVFCGMIAVSILGAATTATASGRMAMPPITMVLASPAACVAEIERLAAEDRRAAAAKTTAPDGATREVVLQTEGMRKSPPDRVHYEATLWFHHGRMRADLGQMEVSHSFETTIRDCVGSTLTIRGERGYGLATFEPPARRRP